MTPEERAGVELLTEACERWEAMPPLPFIIGRLETYALVIACQAVQVHPAFPPSMKTALERTGKRLMEAVCDTPEIYAFLASGWNRDLDVTPDKETTG